MKSIAEAKWRVQIYYAGNGRQGTEYFWNAGTSDAVLFYFADFRSSNSFTSRNGAKKAWLRFAKLNGIKNWEWVE